ncbi:MAG: dihydrofolate synthase [Bacteroidetes bacterium HGW-Bacteroidetes-17]|jgi:dihydrofolate synthase/folylpolyglutamate synthase|nr:MAG: dihydrofolate synthase [Bacteroidetes bacterium HGW-Bacteroidetes-17]
MNYPETLDYLFSQLPMYQRVGKAAYKANLDNTIALLGLLNNPHNHFKSIHIAGTNGKGSVAHMLASIFQTAGYKTGLYTSPHLNDFRERIKINGQMIPEEKVIDFVEKYKSSFETIKPSFFEMTVGLAFQYFENEKVDMAIIETGMGGRLDSTNLITPELSIITNIGMDHMQFLGDTLEKIAGEKAEIIKVGIPIIIGRKQTETQVIFTEKALQQKTNIFFAEDIFDAKRLTNSTLEFSEYDVWRASELYIEHLQCPLLGAYQSENIVTVIQACDLLAEKYGLSVTMVKEGIEDVLKNTGLKGRWQLLSKNPLTICDTGHNKDGLTAVVNQLKGIQCNQLHFVLGFVNDKNITDLLNLLPRNATYYFCRADIPRALDEKVLEEQAHKAGLRGQSYGSVREAYNSAVNNATSNDMVFIGGSTFVVAEVV